MKPCFGEKHDLTLRNIEKKWKMPAREWKGALNQFAVLYADRIGKSAMQM